MSVQEALKLGAYDLKRYANRNLGIAFLIALVLHVVLLGYPMVANIFDKEEVQEENLINTGPITLEDFQNEDEELQAEDDSPVNEVVPPPPMAETQTIGTGSENAMAQLEIVEGLEDGLDIESFKKMNISTPKGGGDGGAPPLDPSLLEMPEEINFQEEEKKVQQSKPKEYEDFIGDGTEPQFDMGEVKRNLVYPPTAFEAGIEGTVWVKVFINEFGQSNKNSCRAER